MPNLAITFSVRKPIKRKVSIMTKILYGISVLAGMALLGRIQPSQGMEVRAKIILICECALEGLIPSFPVIIK